MPPLTRPARPTSIALVLLAAAAAACSDATAPAPLPDPAAAASDSVRSPGASGGTPNGGAAPDTVVPRPSAAPGVISGWVLRPYDRAAGTDSTYAWGAAIGATVTVHAVTPGDSATARAESLRQVATATIGVDGAFRTAELPDGIYRVRGAVTVGGVPHAGEQTIRLAGRQQLPAFLHVLLRP